MAKRGRKELVPGRRDKNRRCTSGFASVGASGLTYREMIFAKAYIFTEITNNGVGNGTQAAIAAGVTRKSAGGQASAYMRNPNVRKFIDKSRYERMKVLDMTAESVLIEMGKLAYSNMFNYLKLDEAGDPHVDFSALTPDSAAAIQEVTIDEYTEGKGEDARQVKRVKFKLHDKRGALELVGKFHKLWTDKTELSGADGKPLPPASLQVVFVDPPAATE